jgi:acyl carrier protein
LKRYGKHRDTKTQREAALSIDRAYSRAVASAMALRHYTVHGGEVGSDKDRIVQLVQRSVDEINEELEDSLKLTMDPQAIFYGEGARVDSITLVSLIVAIEENLRREFGLSVTLANEKAMSMERSPFRTLGTIIDYVTAVVSEAQPK